LGTVAKVGMTPRKKGMPKIRGRPLDAPSCSARRLLNTMSKLYMILQTHQELKAENELKLRDKD
jgi:hypothetical protein